MNTHRQQRVDRLTKFFKKVEQRLNDGYVVLWDCERVLAIDWSEGLTLTHASGNTDIFYASEEWEDLADMKIAEIEKELEQYLVVSKRVKIKF